jgi:microcin C transport system ATP-binding protein
MAMTKADTTTRATTASTQGARETLIDVRGLKVAFRSGTTDSLAVKGASFHIGKGETVALVGESGSGKSVSALSIMRLLPYPAASHPGGEILFEGRDLLKADEREMQKVRGNRISIIFQEPMTSLNPLHTIEKQVGEVLRVHRGLDEGAARMRVVELLSKVGIRDAVSRLADFPHQLSGGQRQRVMIAMALANEPDLLIADEPTTALDVTIQAQILELLADLKKEFGLSMLLITHDLGIVRRMSDRVYVMRHGEIVEEGATEAVFVDPKHPYTKHLIESEPKGRASPAPADSPVLVETDDLKVWFPIKRGMLRKTVDHIKAVDGVSLKLREGDTLGVVGESGSGKTTLGLAILRLISSEGPIVYSGRRIDGLGSKEMRPLRKEMQIVFQDPYGSLSPRLSISQIIEEGLQILSPELTYDQRRDRVRHSLKEVGLDPDSLDRYPHEFSGGQRQRIAIARATVLEPKFIMLDEPTSALDQSVQAQIVDLLRDLQKKRGLGYLFISHDLKVVRALCNEVIVMRNGKVVETGTAEEIFAAPKEDYTKALLAAAFDLKVVNRGATAV